MEDIIYMVYLIWIKNNDKRFKASACKTLQDAKIVGERFAKVVENTLGGDIVCITIEKQEYNAIMKEYFSEGIENYWSLNPDTKEWRKY